MQNDELEVIEEYRKSHPEVEEIMREFQIAQDAYDAAMALLGTRVRPTGSSYTLTTGGSYNANISKSA